MTLLVIDDDQVFCLSLADFFSTQEIEVLIAPSAKTGLEFCRTRHIDLVLLDENLPDGEGHRLCPAILNANEETKIIFITAFPSFDHAVKALKAGAHDYLSKPFELEELQLAITRSLRTMELEKARSLEAYRATKDRDQHVLTGDFGDGEKTRNLIRLAAETNSPLLISGETGTGKGVVARAIHFSGLRKDAPFIPTNCAAIPENLIEAELFGAERGAFTGAVASRKGIFELADGGTLFLDEIGAMPLNLQAKLLSVLDDQRIKRLGGSTFIPVNVRIVAATNANLPEMIRRREFREDLYYRISVLNIHLPPLRQRPGDIPALCRQLLNQFGEGRQAVLPEAELDALSRYPWPGNIRELRNVLERSLLLHRQFLRPSELLQATDDAMSPSGGAPSLAPVVASPQPAGLPSLEAVNREHIARVLAQYEGNWTRAARVLGISISTLKRKAREYHLS